MNHIPTGRLTADQPRAALPAEETFFFGDTRVAILASVIGGEGFCVIEHTMPFGESPPLHVHTAEDEFFLVIEGRMRFQIGGEEQRVLGPRGTLMVLRGTPHTFRVESPEGARCLTVTLGTDFERMVRQVSRPAHHPGLPPRGEGGAEAIVALAHACARNNIRILGAPLG